MFPWVFNPSSWVRYSVYSTVAIPSFGQGSQNAKDVQVTYARAHESVLCACIKAASVFWWTHKNRVFSKSFFRELSAALHIWLSEPTYFRCTTWLCHGAASSTCACDMGEEVSTISTSSRHVNFDLGATNNAVNAKNHLVYLCIDKHSRMGWWWWHIHIISYNRSSGIHRSSLCCFDSLQPGANTQEPQPLWILNTAKRHTGFGWVQYVRDHSSYVHRALSVYRFFFLLDASFFKRLIFGIQVLLVLPVIHQRDYSLKGEAWIIMWFISSPLSCVPNKFHTLFQKQISEAVEPPTKLWSRALRHHCPAQFFQSAIVSTQRRSEGLK